jgi:hypothetical protein
MSGFPGNSNNLHRIVVDDFTDSMHYLLMVRIAQPPLVRRCNGTTAGPGYWKVGLEWPYNTPPGQ